MDNEIDKIKKHLDSLTKNTIFNFEEHTYKVKGVFYKSVSETIVDYSRGIDRVPKKIMEEARERGNYVHEFMEQFLKEHNGIANKKVQKYVKRDYYEDYLINGIKYIEKQFSSNWNILSVEQILYNVPNRVCGTADLIMYRIKGNNLELKIIDWKTGTIKLANHIQIEIYKRLLEHSINRFRIENLIIKTELVSLKPAYL
ncbi:MAG: hypothetical protein GY679_03960 [Mycoplasma sp.]|nr:hypothetical protein [Mycoplasma sp.]